MTTLTLPLLFLADTVVLPGMVVPVELDRERQAAVDAARLAAKDNNGDNQGDSHDSVPLQVLVVPRLDDKYGAVGAVAEIAQIGRLPGGEPAVVLRATGRARVGVGVNGPGAALWVEAEILEVPAADDATRELAREYKSV
ncbi:MAG TPA: LON peptidase substrate-binding domain-containing protein, partial [Actinopolymorphaceae bacterium]|nr:LON peptidase substrate-binding domain-containing protein [Actinopolymorphaceae bacterium]